MKREAQTEINLKVLEIIGFLDAELSEKYYTWTRLRSCSAHVAKTERFRVLMSYNTIVACIDMTTGIGYDFLRYVYGYTPTSAQHISKFMHDYAAQSRLTYYPV